MLKLVLLSGDSKGGNVGYAPPVVGTVFSRTAWTIFISLFVYYIHSWKNAHFIRQAYHKNAPNVTSTLSGLWPVQLKPLTFASFPHFPPFPLVSSSVPVLLRPLMLESHKLEFVFCLVELFSYHHWQRGRSC